MVKVIMTWDIQDGKEKEYIEFAVNELSPTLGALGLQINDVWYTMYGSGPEMVVSGLMDSRADALGLLQSRDWAQLRRHLAQFVDNINVKIVPPKGPFQM
ncbi:MAG TPA: hypothetical protein VFZ66_05345 [Herpetosiphonaceae bacterium]